MRINLAILLLIVGNAPTIARAEERLFREFPITLDKPGRYVGSIEGRLFVWRNDGPPPYWNTPNAKRIFDAGAHTLKEHEGKIAIYVNPNGKVHEGFICAKDADHIVLSEKFTEQCRWTYLEGRRFNEVDDAITPRWFRAEGEGERQWLGVSKEGMKFKNKDGKEFTVYPLCLTDRENASKVRFNDFSGK